MTDREHELERQLRYVLQKSHRYTEAVTELLEAGLRVMEESTQGKPLDAVLHQVREAKMSEIGARTLLDYSMKLAWDFLEAKEVAA